MVARTSQAVQFQGGSGVALDGARGGYARGDVERNRTSSDRAGIDTNESSTTRLLGSIVGEGLKLVNQAIEINKTEAYLTGAAKAGQIASEDELEGDIFTRDYQRAGYRDTMGRVAIAENEARIMRDMPAMREKSPEEFNSYLAERRAELMGSLEGMSRQQRSGAFQNMLMNDRAAIKTHQSEHMKFQVETENRSVQAAVKIKHTAMDKAKVKDDAATYQAATDAAFSTYQSAIVQNPKLSAKNKSALLVEAMSAALESDHQGLYTLMKEAEIPLADGVSGTMASLIPFEDAVKLSKAYRGSLEHTEAQRSFGFTLEVARMRADWDDPSKPLMPEAQVRAQVEEGVRRGFYKMEKVDGIMQDYYKASAKKAVQGPLAAAWASGDQDKIGRLGKTDEEGLEAWLNTVGTTMNPAERVASLTTIGLVQGRPAALKQLGREIAPGLAQLGMTENLDMGNAQALASTLLMLDKTEKSVGMSGATAALMSSYPQEMQDKLMSYREFLRLGHSPDVAVTMMMKYLEANSKMDPQTRAAMGVSHGKDNADIIGSMEPRSLLDTLGLGLKSIVSKGAGDRLATSVRSSWFENPERVAEVGADMKYAMAEELRILSLTHPMASKEARQSMATAQLIGRTVETSSGPLMIPRGTSLQSFFGVPTSTGAQRVGAAIDEAVAPADGNRLAYSVQNGKIAFREFGKDGQLIRSGHIDPKQVAPMVSMQQDRESEQFRVVHGGGRTLSGVTFNGDNTSGLDNVHVFNTRQSLLQSGAAIKVNMKSMSKEQKAVVDKQFMLMTDKAVSAARLPMKTTGKTGQAALTFFTELALISDNKFTSDKQYRPLLQAMVGTDPAPALTALYQTPAYKNAEPQVQARFTAAINSILKGN